MTMVRVLVAFAVIAALSAAGAWLARHPGTVAMHWQDYTIETSVGVLLAALALIALGLAALVLLFTWARALPSLFGRGRRRSRRRQGYLALARGLVAVAAGDAGEARRQARRADELLAEQPALTKLLSAQAAQLDGDDGAARRYFAQMLKQRETEFLGVRGLLTIAEHEGDAPRALALARRADELRPATPWVVEKRFELEVAAGDWRAAETTARAALKRKAMPEPRARRLRAVVLLERSRLAAAEGLAERALVHAEKAHALDPDFAAASLRIAALLVTAGEERRARRAIEAAWALKPHPQLAELYLKLGANADALHRLKQVETLAALAPDHRESHIAVARAALDAKLWGQARKHLKAALATGVTSGVARLMAELEEAEHRDAAAARGWLARAAEAEAEPGWLCGRCGAQADAWSARCGNCGAFDAIDWKSPPRVATLPPAEAAYAATQALPAEAATAAPAEPPKAALTAR
ncbi:MAG TPA: heme biosynthesis HemY N-terminal domain-containing protein [Alphaproteobacteria bacterium]|nr:heme biosynthesis HemY N-terminal domain-containing protein [Alphaproteobacteria bacterium]